MGWFSNKDDSNRIVFRAMPVLGRPGVDCHIRLFQQLLPADELVAAEFLAGLRAGRTPGSFNTIVYGFLASARMGIGPQLYTDANFERRVSDFFRQFLLKVRLSPPKRILTPEQVATLQHATNQRHGLLCAGLYATAARASEFADIRLRDCEVDQRRDIVRIQIRTLKGGENRRVWVPRMHYERVRRLFQSREYLYEREDHSAYTRQALLESTYGCGRAELGWPVNPHLFRHSWATHTYQANPHRIREIMAYLGHRSVNTFLKYYVHAEELDPEEVPILPQAHGSSGRFRQRSPKTPPRTLAMIRRLAGKGLSSGAIAEQIGMSRSSLYRAARAAGIHFRRESGSNRAAG